MLQEGAPKHYKVLTRHLLSILVKRVHHLNKVVVTLMMSLMSLTSEISLLLLLSAISSLLEFAVTQSPQWLMVKTKIETRP